MNINIPKEGTRARSMAKTISWRVIATITTTTIAYIVTGNLTMAAEIGFIEVISKMIFYYFHERVWNRI